MEKAKIAPLNRRETLAEKGKKSVSTRRVQVEKKASHTGMTPLPSTESEESSDISVLSSEEEYKRDKKNDFSYRDESYWKLPENVRHAVDLSQAKSPHTDFSMKLT